MFSLELPKLSQSAVFRNFFTCVEESNNMKGYVWKSVVKLGETDNTFPFALSVL